MEVERKKEDGEEPDICPGGVSETSVDSSLVGKRR